MTGPTVAVLDYGSGNVRSAVRALERAGAQATLTSDRQHASSADGLVVPGVGAFAACKVGLDAIAAGELIADRLSAGRAVLGICVGMQVLFERGVEHGVETAGFGTWPGVVEQLEASVLPHMGWNTLSPPAQSQLFAGVESERFYFVHSYGVRHWPSTQPNEPDLPGPDLPGPDLPGRGGAARAEPLLTWSVHDSPFVAAVEDGPLSATQFHPEKSGHAGQVLLRNWIATL